MDEQAAPGPADEVRCAECRTRLAEGQDREVTERGAFCRTCFDNLRAQLARAVEAQGEDINYPRALMGALGGGAAGALAWWGFTVLTHVAFGLVAVVIGFAVGKGVVLMSAGKRSRGLQTLSVAVALLSFFYATYLVNRTFLLKASAEQGTPAALSLLPGPALFFNVVALGFGLMDLVFLAIVVYESWKIPAPVRLAA